MNGVDTEPRSYEAECHDKVPWDQLQVQERAELKQLPDWLRRALGLPERFRRGHEARVAAEVEFCLNEILERMVAGCSRDLQSSCTIKTPVLVATANKVLDKWHDMYEKVCKDEDIVPELSRTKRLDNKWIYKFLHRWQWSHQNSNTKGAYLPDTSAEMADMRKAHRAQREINGVSWPLVLNFDQMWKSAYEPPSKVLHKTQHRNKDKEICRPADGERLKVISQIVYRRSGSTDWAWEWASKQSAERLRKDRGAHSGCTSHTVQNVFCLFVATSFTDHLTSFFLRFFTYIYIYNTYIYIYIIYRD